MTISVPVSYGDFFDRMTILEIKSERVKNVDRLEIVNEALAEYRAITFVSIPEHVTVAELIDELRCTNQTIWDNENRIRMLDRVGEFGAEFVEAARCVCHCKDRRTEIKSEIDKILGSEDAEVKDYQVS